MEEWRMEARRTEWEWQEWEGAQEWRKDGRNGGWMGMAEGWEWRKC